MQGIFAVIALSLALRAYAQKTAEQCTTTQENQDFSFGGKNGPDHWAETFPECSGQYQSPIDIDPSKTQANDPKVEFSEFDKPLNGRMENAGENLFFFPNDDVDPQSLTLNGVKYIYDHSDYHFGAAADDGTPHSISGKKYAMESHIVFRRDDAATIVVLSLFFATNATSPNPAFQDFADAAGLVTYKGDSAPVTKPLNLKSLVAQTCSDGVDGVIYFYSGSYIYPPCSEDVVWVIIEQPISISEDQMTAFRQQRATTKDNSEDCSMYRNFRPQQPVRNHVIYKGSNFCSSLK